MTGITGSASYFVNRVSNVAEIVTVKRVSTVCSDDACLPSSLARKVKQSTETDAFFDDKQRLGARCNKSEDCSGGLCCARRHGGNSGLATVA